MSLLQFVIIVSAVIFVLFGLDLYKRKKMNILHFLVFFVGGGMIVGFVFNPQLLDQFGRFFGVARGADLVIYGGLIVLVYFYLGLINKQQKEKMVMTKLVREISLSNSIGSLSTAKIVFVIPAYNEKHTIVPVIESVLKQGHGVILVDDGNNGNLSEELQKKHQDDPFVLIKHTINLGQGAALETGAEYVRKHGEHIEYIVHFDADGQHRLEDLPHFIHAFEKDPKLEIVLGSRFLGGTVNMPKSRKYALKLGILFTRIFSGIKLTDTHNGYRMLRKEVLDKLAITMNRMEHASEIIDIIKHNRIKYKEVPIVVIYSDYSLAKGQKIGNGIRIIKELIYKKIFFR